jgi:hypothetical protein
VIAVSLFDYTGNMLKPWQEAGYECHIVDVQHWGETESGRARADGMICHAEDLSTPDRILRFLKYVNFDFVSAFPPCDHLAVSGARWFKGKGLRKLAHSINLFATAAEICEASGAPYMIENPVSTISTYWRKPDYTFHPSDYTGFELGDNYSKKTCLWTGGGFVMPEANKAEGLGEPDDRIHKCAPGPDRANIRSATPMGFARAVFEANARRHDAAA